MTAPIPSGYATDRPNCPTPSNYWRKLAIEYMVFDLLSLNNPDLRKLPCWSVWPSWKSVCRSGSTASCTLFSPGFVAFGTVQEAGMEGIVAKRKNSATIPPGNTTTV
jgi:bifunctional non-homologous end joining protein LigD